MWANEWTRPRFIWQNILVVAKALWLTEWDKTALSYITENHANFCTASDEKLGWAWEQG